MENTLKSREHILEQLEGFPDELERVIFADHVTDEDIFRPGSDGGWGVIEVLPHLRDWEAIYMERARMIVDEDNPHIAGYDDSLWPIERDYRGQDPEQVVSLRPGSLVAGGFGQPKRPARKLHGLIHVALMVEGEALVRIDPGAPSLLV